MDKIDRMIVTEILQLRKKVNESRAKLGLPERNYHGIPTDQNATLAGTQISDVD